MRIEFLIVFCILFTSDFFSAVGSDDVDLSEALFGSVFVDELPLHFQVKLKNTSADKIRVINLKSGCGCVTGTPEPLMLLPGQSGSITLVITDKAVVGPFASSYLVQYEKQGRVFTSGPFSIKGEIKDVPVYRNGRFYVTALGSNTTEALDTMEVELAWIISEKWKLKDVAGVNGVEVIHWQALQTTNNSVKCRINYKCNWKAVEQFSPAPKLIFSFYANKKSSVTNIYLVPSDYLFVKLLQGPVHEGPNKGQLTCGLAIIIEPQNVKMISDRIAERGNGDLLESESGVWNTTLAFNPTSYRRDQIMLANVHLFVRSLETNLQLILPILWNEQEIRAFTVSATPGASGRK